MNAPAKSTQSRRQKPKCESYPAWSCFRARTENTILEMALSFFSTTGISSLCIEINGALKLSLVSLLENFNSEYLTELSCIHVPKHIHQACIVTNLNNDSILKTRKNLAIHK